jgi:hypothetical protein
MYGPTILMESVMPSGLAGKTFSFGAAEVSAAEALITSPAQTTVRKWYAFFIREMKRPGVTAA